jgi:hypothetical protein
MYAGRKPPPFNKFYIFVILRSRVDGDASSSEIPLLYRQRRLHHLATLLDRLAFLSTPLLLRCRPPSSRSSFS